MSLVPAEGAAGRGLNRMSGGKNVILIGFSGSGKSAVGPLLASRLGVKFVDADCQIEELAGCTISQIFEQQGEKAFRTMELQVVEKLMQRRTGAVIALGGGAFENRAIRKLVFGRGQVVYLSCSRRELYRRLRQVSDRPLLDVVPRPGQTLREARLNRIGRLLDKRLTNYRRADFIFSTTGKTERQAAAQLSRLLGR